MILQIVSFALIVVGSFLSTAFIYFNYIYLPYKLKVTEFTLTDLTDALITLIELQLSIYEKNVFDNRGGITNSNFENYYTEITEEIINSLSDNLITQFSRYMSTEALISIICRYVREWLTNKITGV